MTQTVLLLDVMDTLVKDPFWTVFPDFFGCDLKAIFSEKSPDAWPAFERAEIDEETYFQTAFHSERTFDGPALKRALIDGYALLPGIAELLDELKGRQVPMHLLSNYPIWYRDLEAKLCLTRWAPWTFVSHETGVRKPDPGAYRGPVEKLGVSPSSLLFVDDRAKNCEGAQREGLRAVVFENADQLRSALQREGVL